MNSIMRNERLEVVVKSKGAELASIKTLPDGFEYLWQGDSAWWAGQSPVFFPIIGKLETGAHEVEGKSYQMGVHGFARDCDFELIKEEPLFLQYRLKNTAFTFEKYPYEFELEISYRLDGVTLIIAYEVRNCGNRTMPYSIGGHPGFNCPFEDDGTMNDYILEFEQAETVARRIVQDGFLLSRPEPFLLNEKIIKLSKELFGRLAIVMNGLRSRYVTLKRPGSNRSVTVNFEGFTTLALWSPAAGGALLCIEPWKGNLPTKGIGVQLVEREGINLLVPGSSEHHEFSIVIQ